MKHIENAHSDSIVLNTALVNSIRKPVRPARQVDFLVRERGRKKQQLKYFTLWEVVLVVITSRGRAKAIRRRKAFVQAEL